MSSSSTPSTPQNGIAYRHSTPASAADHPAGPAPHRRSGPGPPEPDPHRGAARLWLRRQLQAGPSLRPPRRRKPPNSQHNRRPPSVLGPIPPPPCPPRTLPNNDLAPGNNVSPHSTHHSGSDCTDGRSSRCTIDTDLTLGQSSSRDSTVSCERKQSVRERPLEPACLAQPGRPRLALICAASSTIVRIAGSPPETRPLPLWYRYARQLDAFGIHVDDDPCHVPAQVDLPHRTELYDVFLGAHFCATNRRSASPRSTSLLLAGHSQHQVCLPHFLIRRCQCVLHRMPPVCVLSKPIKVPDPGHEPRAAVRH